MRYATDERGAGARPAAIAAFTRGITSVAMSSIERRPSAGSAQS
jgi:hypothetical protein